MVLLCMQAAACRVWLRSVASLVTRSLYRTSGRHVGERVMQGPAERAAAAEKVRLEQGAAAAAARREQMAAAAEARMRALSLASQQQQLWCRPFRCP